MNDFAREIAAQCWCDKRTEHKEMDIELAEVFAEILSSWIDTAKFHANGEEYYRGLLERCGEIIGDRAYICDDGTISEDVLVAKIPEILDADYCNGGG